jgi:predicted TPR repeat methyltransferase
MLTEAYSPIEAMLAELRPAEAFRHAQQLQRDDGVDLSVGMLECAETKACYDQLYNMPVAGWVVVARAAC